MNNKSKIGKATNIFKEAVDLDNKSKITNAITKYEKGLEIALNVIFRTNPYGISIYSQNNRDKWLEKIKQYKNRIQILKNIKQERIRYEYPPELYFYDKIGYSVIDFKKQFKINDLNDCTLTVSQVIITAIKFLEDYEQRVLEYGYSFEQLLISQNKTNNNAKKKANAAKLIKEYRTILSNAQEQISRTDIFNISGTITNCLQTIQNLQRAYLIIRVNYDLYLRLGNKYIHSIAPKLPPMKLPLPVKQKKDFYMYIDLLFSESKDGTQKPAGMGLNCEWYWLNVLQPFFVKNKLSLVNTSRNITSEVKQLVQILSEDNRLIYRCFVKLYSEWKGGEGGGIADLVNMMKPQGEPAQQQQQRLQAEAMSAGGGKKKKNKYIKRKKITIKKVGVYRSKGGYYYRRYKNCKVKRISKETYKKLK